MSRRVLPHAGLGGSIRLLVFVLAVFVVAGFGEARANDLEIRGSTTVLPIMQEIQRPFTQLTGTQLSISGGGSSNGIRALIDGTCDIAMSSREMKDKELGLAEDKGVDPRRIPIALDALHPVVHPTNPIGDLSIEQLRDIYIGRIENWKELGGPNKAIAVISRDTSSGTFGTWKDIVMQGKRVFPGALLQASNGAIATEVANNQYAIGYIGHGYLNDNVKALSVAGVEGTPQTTRSGEYPISRELYLYTNGEPDRAVKSLVDFILSEQGQKLVEQAGYVAID
jgi:phosphate transport system substrate-binding protein